MIFLKKQLITLMGFAASIIFTIISFAIYSSVQTSTPTSSTTAPTSPYQNWNNRSEVVFTKELSSQYHWTYSNDNSKFIQACNTWAHDSLFYADDQLVSYYDNKVLSGRDRSYLRDHTGELMYEVETGSVWNTIINHNRILVSYLIYDNNSNVIAYVDGVSFLEDNFNINSLNGDQLFNINRNRFQLTSWQWTFTQSRENNLPLSLAVSIASKISFSGDNTDICNSIFKSTYIIGFCFLGLTSVTLIYLGYLLYKSVCNNNDIRHINNYSGKS